MFVIIGVLVVLGSVIGGFMLEKGPRRSIISSRIMTVPVFLTD